MADQEGGRGVRVWAEVALLHPSHELHSMRQAVLYKVSLHHHNYLSKLTLQMHSPEKNSARAHPRIFPSNSQLLGCEGQAEQHHPPQGLPRVWDVPQGHAAVIGGCLSDNNVAVQMKIRNHNKN